MGKGSFTKTAAIVIYKISHKQSFVPGFGRSPFEVASICFTIGCRSPQDQKNLK
jgi:hypothetical protein